MNSLLRLLLLSGGLLGLVLTAAPGATKGAAPQRIAHGEVVTLADYLVPGKTVVFDFTSEFCPPCRGYDQPLQRLHAQRADIVVVQVDINRPGLKKIDWQSPVARQFNLRSIPAFMIYGPDGRLIAEDKGREGSPARQLVDGWIAELAP